ncbi:hypothetical protein GWI33_004474 [Rhynchophorus ferrugineus]|uniref:Uncharacterized protein n=1 Tax=Rhynchophorus ferrugineus TaxID=354439 RepID=A0A834MIP4_RHYFE|nr:hypothetical protein GWI33_004474 [Rhynchophorus ferrugineus]
MAWDQRYFSFGFFLVPCGLMIRHGRLPVKASPRAPISNRRKTSPVKACKVCRVSCHSVNSSCQFNLIYKYQWLLERCSEK